MGLPSFLTQENPMKADPQSGLVTAWSSSTLDKFNECAYRIYLQYVKRLKVVLSEDDQKEKDAAKGRGEELHSTIEDFILWRSDKLPAKIKHRRGVILQYREWVESQARNVHIEEAWAFDPLWAQTAWRDKETWARFKLDALFFESETSARLDDWKSGKKYGNEGKHMGQLMRYAVATFMRFPKLQFIKCRMQYIDLATDNTLERNVSREQAMKYLIRLENQALAMTTCTDFRPCPNKRNCQYCDFAHRIPNTDERYCAFAIVEL